MQTRRQTLKQSAVVAGLLAGTGLFPQYAQAFNKAAFEAKNLGDALKAAAGGQADPSVVIQADGKAPHQAVVTVMEAARRAGLSQITFATQSSASAGKAK